MKRKILWMLLSFLLVAALVLASCAKEVPGEQEEEEEEQEEEEEEEVVTLRIGGTYQTSEVVVTVSEAIVTDSYEYYDKGSDSMLSREADPGTFFLIATVDIENVSGSTRFRDGRTRIYVSDSDGNEYSTRSYFGEDVLAPRFQFFAGDKMEGKVLFYIQEGASGLRLEYRSVEIRTAETPTRVFAEWVIE